MSGLDLDAIKARANAATPGPWRWDGHTRFGIRLDSITSGRPIVMGFVRHGMRGAQPTFWDRKAGEHPAHNGTYRKAVDIAVLEVPYRDDVVALRNADAEFIAHSRADVEALIAEVERLRGVRS